MRYLLVGLGNIGRKRQALLGDRCVATVDPFTADAQFASAEDCPTDAYEAVVVATPNQSKLDLLEFFVSRGKQVLVEKPLLFTNPACAQHLSDVAQSAGATWYTSYNHRFETLIASARNYLQSGRIGEVYHARLVYGNGTVGNVVGTWRDQGLGVLEDLGSHLLDLAADLFGCGGQRFLAWSLEHHEAASFDHCVLASDDRRIVLEVSYLAWKNTFGIDVFGSRGSLHVNGLQKWGPSELILRERVLPSGVPVETREHAPGSIDPTWQRDLEHFEHLCSAPNPTSSVDNDLWISRTLLEVAGRMSTTAFLGMSHLGINYAAAWSSFGQPTIGFDADAALVTRLEAGDLPIQEPGLPELVQQSGECLKFSSDFRELRGCKLAIVARDVPTDDDNNSDLEPVRMLIDRAVEHLDTSATLVVMSQIPPGFMRALSSRLGSRLAGIYYWVETLIFGDAVRRALHPERMIIGCADPAADLPDMLAHGLARFACPVLPMRYESAELTKTAINLYLIGSVTYANTLSELCESVGANWSEMVPALRLDARIGPVAYLRPSLGIAGGNLERDLVTLRKLCSAGSVDAAYIDGLIDYNAHRLEWVQRQLDRRVLRSGGNCQLAIWGLTYKKNTRSTKNSPSLRIISALGERVHMRAWDPAIAPGELQLGAEVVADQYVAVQGADALLVMADWDQFADADLARVIRSMRRPLVIDCAGVLERRRSEMQDFEYVGMGQ